MTKPVVHHPPDLAQPRPTRALAKAAAIGLAWAAGFTVPGLVLNAFEHSLQRGERLSPLLIESRDLLALLPVLSFVLPVLFISRLVRCEVSRSRRLWAAVALATAQLVLVTGAAVGNLKTQWNPDFGPRPPLLSVRSPDGRRTAHFSLDCLLTCTGLVHVQEGFALTMRGVEAVRRYDEEADLPQLVWSPDSREVKLIRPSESPHADPAASAPSIGLPPSGQ